MEKKQKLVDVFVAVDGTEHTSEFRCLEHERGLAEVKALNKQQEYNAATLREHAAAVDRVRARWEQHPEEREMFLAVAKAKHLEVMDRGVEYGWWADVKPNGDPIPNPVIIKVSELEPHETLMAHIVCRMEIFPSVSEAKKNGWNKPIVLGDIWLKKKTIHVRIEP